MDNMQSARALRPVGPEPGGMLVHTAADRRLAVEHWLLSTLPETGRKRARMEWREHGMAMLPLGTLFAAVRIPSGLVSAVTGAVAPNETDVFLQDALRGGPVICDGHQRCYYALVPGSVPRTWRDAVGDWVADDVGVLGLESYLGVPRVDAVDVGSAARSSYWSVPMESPALLCAPLVVARLIAAGRRCLEEEAGG